MAGTRIEEVDGSIRDIGAEIDNAKGRVETECTRIGSSLQTVIEKIQNNRTNIDVPALLGALESIKDRVENLAGKCDDFDNKLKVLIKTLYDNGCWGGEPPQ